MNENNSSRLHDVFFYGLYMDPGILQEKGVQIRNPRRAIVYNYDLRIGKKATLLRSKNAMVQGMVYALTYAELDSLYWGAGLDEYIAEALIAEVENEKIPVLCCNLLVPPENFEKNLEYENNLVDVRHALDILFEESI